MGTPANATVGAVHGPETQQAQSFTRAQMGDMYIGEAEIPPVEYKVYLYTVSRQEFVVQQPPLVPYLIIPACGEGDEYKLVVEIPNPMLQIERHPDKNEAAIYRHKAERVAQSLCNPNNASLDQDFKVKNPTGWGDNLNAKGVFWSRNNPPTKAEIEAAKKRRHGYFEGLIEQARQLELVDPKELQNVLNPDYHQAAEYFGLETSWHRKLVSKVECPNCGEPIKSLKLIYHVNSLGLICILDQERYTMAVDTAKPSSPVIEAKGKGPESPSAPRKI